MGHGLVWSGLVFCEVTNDHVAKKYMATVDVGCGAGKNASAAA